MTRYLAYAWLALFLAAILAGSLYLVWLTSPDGMLVALPLIAGWLIWWSLGVIMKAKLPVLFPKDRP